MLQKTLFDIPIWVKEVEDFDDKKRKIYENQINRPLQKIQRYTFSAYCRPAVVNKEEE